MTNQVMLDVPAGEFATVPVATAVLGIFRGKSAFRMLIT